MNPRLLFVAGPNGSGKTTITSRIVAHDWAKDVLYINPDEIAQKDFQGWNDDKSVLKAAQRAEQLRNCAFQQGKDLMFETVFSGTDKLKFVIAAKTAGYFV